MNYLTNALLGDMLNVVQRVYCLKLMIRSQLRMDCKEWYYSTIEEAKKAEEMLISRCKEKQNNIFAIEIKTKIEELAVNKKLNNEEIDDILKSFETIAAPYTYSTGAYRVTATNNSIIANNVASCTNNTLVSNGIL